ncbi:MAG: GNAT family acetyltransferase [Acidimicrobiaceae bacterium]|mgnify:FL=1|nr:GNAT family acetyltransferase [Acidimicrobiaceae bacterium]|tara:strand:- start:612 stop:1106 length:495 start_codon:yes stop_codon:yes gene_type:complete
MRPPRAAAETKAATSPKFPLVVRTAIPADHKRILELWEACGLTRPWNDPRRDLERKLAHDPELLLVGTAPAETTTANRVVATVMAGYEGHRGWQNYVAVDPALSGRGFGRAIVTEGERRLGALGCPKINLQVRHDNMVAIGFWEALGYVVDDAVAMGRRLVPDN